MKQCKNNVKRVLKSTLQKIKKNKKNFGGNENGQN